VFVVKFSSVVQKYISYKSIRESSSVSSQFEVEVFQDENDRQFASQVTMWTFAANCQKCMIAK